MSSFGVGLLIGLAIYGALDVIGDLCQPVEVDESSRSRPTIIHNEDADFGIDGQTICYRYKTDQVTTNIYPN